MLMLMLLQLYCSSSVVCVVTHTDAVRRTHPGLTRLIDTAFTPRAGLPMRPIRGAPEHCYVMVADAWIGRCVRLYTYMLS